MAAADGGQIIPEQLSRHVDLSRIKSRHFDSLHPRCSVRLRDCDYSTPGAYFVTVCTQGNRCLLGEITCGRMRLNEAGQMVQSVWDEIPGHYPGVETDAFVVMPNHIHGIILLIHDTVGAAPRGRPNETGQPRKHFGQAQGPAPTKLSLPDVVHHFKTMTTKLYADGVKKDEWQPFEWRLWQRGYYEHVVRRTDRMNRIREYILNNPPRWNWTGKIRKGPAVIDLPGHPWSPGKTKGRHRGLPLHA
jgi:putative transposase